MKHGFSLVELSIVLVILGLLTGGILAGQSLIRAAELRSVNADLSRYSTAIRAFQDKYFALPGDMRNATKFWTAQAGGTADGYDAACQVLDRNNPATGAATCNGNGDGQIGTFGNLAYVPNGEVFRAWQHLANAGLVEGSYAGVTDSTINNYTDGPVTRPGWNIPRSRVGTAGFNLSWFGNDPDPTNTFLMLGNYGNVLIFGASSGVIIHNMAYGPAISPEEAWNIDTKMDDGRPGTGAVMPAGVSGNGNPNCASANSTAATYNLSTSGVQCGLIFKTGF